MLKKLTLVNFRNYSKRDFDFSDRTTLIVGPNAAGKTNVLEAIYLLTTGKSFRAETEFELIKVSEKVTRISGLLQSHLQGQTLQMASGLEIVWDARGRFQKLYRVNGVGRRQVDFVGNLRAVLFSPLDLEIVVNGPAVRRKYLDLVLVQVHKDYRSAFHIYERALRQRNRILRNAREKGQGVREIEGVLEYWSRLLIENGKVIHEHRKEFLEFLSEKSGEEGRPGSFPINLHYDHSTVSAERLKKYAVEEIGAAATLVGPHRDDFTINSSQLTIDSFKDRDLRLYGSRGEQRLGVFSIKLGEMDYIVKETGQRPILLLDDIFSELDHENRKHILEMIPKQQTIMTTTDLHLVEKSYLKKVELVKIG